MSCVEMKSPSGDLGAVQDPIAGISTPAPTAAGSPSGSHSNAAAIP